MLKSISPKKMDSQIMKGTFQLLKKIGKHPVRVNKDASRFVEKVKNSQYRLFGIH